MSEHKVESQISKIQDMTQLVKDWGKAIGAEVDWVDFAYTQPEVQKAVQGIEKKQEKKPQLEVKVGKLKYNEKDCKVLKREAQNRKRLETTVENRDEQDHEQAVAFTDSVSRTISHEITVGVDITLGLKATVGFFEASLEAGLSLSTTKAEETSKSFDFNPQTTVKVRGQHEAHVVAYLDPMPEIHPFKVKVEVTGEIPVYFKERIKYHADTFKVEKSHSGEHLHFIPVEHLFESIKQNQEQIKTDIDFEINKNKKPVVVVFKVEGKTKLMNYGTKIKIGKQTLLPGAKLAHMPQPNLASVKTTEQYVYESKRFFVGYERNAGVTFTEVTEYAKDTEHLCKLIQSIGTARGGVTGMSSADIQYAISQESKTYLKDLDKTHQQELKVLAQQPGRNLTSERHFTGATDTFFKAGGLAELAKQAEQKIEEEKKEKESHATLTSPPQGSKY